MKLNTRFLLLRSAIFLVFALLSWLAFMAMVNAINEQWGKEFAGRQVLFDKHRTLSPLIREIKLARQMAAEPALLAMALHEEDAVLRQRAVSVMERYRFDYRDHSYFAAFARSGNYYFNDADGTYSGKQFRYTLSPKEKNDRWFYATLENGKDYQVNLDPDTHLGVVKVWINVLLKDGNKVLGVVGTGIDLTAFLKESVSIEQPGVHNFFIDQRMAIQLSEDDKLIDFASIAKDESERIKIDVLFKNPLELQQLKRELAELEKRPQSGEVRTLWINYQGEKHLLGIAYLPEVGWFDLTLMNEKSLTVIHGFAWLPLLFVVLFLVAMLILNVFLQRWVLSPIAQLQRATEEVQRGNYDSETPLVGKGEVGALAISFRHMVDVVRHTNQELERKVRERTEALQHLTEIDPLTGLLNRRGMTDRFQKEIARQARQSGSLGMLLLDLDYFKQVNDTYGHAAGDVALCATANILRSMKRSYDHAGRWGGEEFLLLLPDCGEADLLAIAERIREAVAALRVETGTHTFSFTVSIGAHRPNTPQTLDAMLHQVDKALYAAKDDGRNCVRFSHREEE
ncbi:MAG: GGDEF domain-containing protein [Gallionella sp.]|nr:GGDEF domain-containing protein [Gallionella sp.]